MEVRKRTWKTRKGEIKVGWFIDYVDPKTGERKRKTFEGITDKDVADKAAARFYTELMERHHLGKSSGPTALEKKLKLGDFLDADLGRMMAPSTKALETWRHKPLKRILGEHTPVISLTLVDFLNYQKLRAQEVAPSTVNDELAILRAAFNRAVQEERLFKAPGPLPKPLPEQEPHQRFLSESQVEKLFTEFYKLYPEAAEAAEVMYLLGGLRPKELWSLRWDEVDFEHGRVAIRNTKRGNSAKIRYRVIPMTERLQQILLQRKETVGKKSELANALVYGIKPEDRNAKLSPKDRKKAGCKDGVEFNGMYRFGKFFKDAARAAKIPFPETVTPYSLRHSAATNSEGADLTDISYMLGHSDIRTTAKIYRHLKNERLMQGMESLARRTKGTQKSTDKPKASKTNAKS